MKRILAFALASVIVLGAAGCKKEPEDVDLSKDSSDAASDIAAGKDVPIDKVIPKEGK